MSPDPTISIARRFRGPEQSANGGYTAGMVAAFVDAAAVTVTLRQPPPLEIAMKVRTGADGVTRLSLGGSTIAEGASASSPPRVVDSVSVDLAYAAHKSYAGLSNHPFPGCFVCGTTRASGDALLLRPGRIDAGRTACVWTPQPGLADDTGAVGAPFVWAALDCPGGWSADLEGRPMVLGRMSACVEAVPEVGEPCVVMGERLTGDGRKTFTAATLYDSDGRVLACAKHTWIAVDPDRFRDGGAAHQSSAT